MSALNQHFQAKLLILLFLTTLVACNPEGARYEDELDLVLTIENRELNYSDYSSYIVADSVLVLGEGNSIEIDPANQQFIIDALKSQLNSAGWTESSNPMQNGSDVVVLISLLENVNFVVGEGWWDYWGDWGGWGWYPPYPPDGYYPYYPGYPGYCCYSSIYAYREGSLIVEMLDPNEPTANDQLQVLWAGAINALVDGRANLSFRVERGIARMFEDSPYLDKN